MARPTGSYSAPNTGRSTGPPERTGHRSARQALAKGELLRGLALEAKERAIERYEVDGVFLVARDIWSDVEGVRVTHVNAFHAEEQKDKPNMKQIIELGRRVEGLSKTSEMLLCRLEDLRKVKDADDVNYEQILAAEGRSE